MISQSPAESPIPNTTQSDLAVLKKAAETVIHILPGPAVPFTYSSHLSEPVQVERREPLHSRLRRLGYISVVDSVTIPNGHDRQVYAVPAPVHEQAVRFIEMGYTPCPCGHRGIHNRADGGGYECGWSECEQVFSRAEVEG
jgi:hypothetical protein